VSSGSLVNGKRFPTSGPNFRTHSRITSVLGRNSVHSTVRDICLDAYAALEATTISQSFVYGEAGWPSGGPFSPHKTHQNGLAVDFMVPVLDVDSNSPRRLPTHPFNLAGYALDFDQSGGRGSMRLDFDAIAAHVLALNDAAKLQGATIKLVIFAPDLQDELFAAGQGHELKRAVKFNSNQAWVRHDEHYHVVFGL
jgi:penicillin-insensitive murein endopeptidase